MKYIFLIYLVGMGLTSTFCQNLTSKEKDELNYQIEKRTAFYCYIIPLDSVQRELNRLIVLNFDSTYIMNNFKERGTTLHLHFKKNGTIKKIKYYKNKEALLYNRKLRRIVLSYIKDLKYFNIAYRDYYGNPQKIKFTMLPIAFDRNGKLIITGWNIK